jgi:Fic-DOC domain mobile mystery protein B
MGDGEQDGLFEFTKSVVTSHLLRSAVDIPRIRPGAALAPPCASDVFEDPEDATPLTPEESRELIPAHIAYRSELNDAEQENIGRAQDWALGRRRDLLTEKFIKDLHCHMLGDVWRWAGKFRTSERNLGIPSYEIPVPVRQLLDDTRVWIEQKAYRPDEIAVRFHHRLVQIHAFPNGNGRHARLMADLLVMRLGGERFS